MENEFAFACPDNGTETCTTWQGQNGLTKREYFAAKALQGLMVQSIPGTHNQNAENWNMERANFAVDMADTLIRALAKKEA